jgi:methylenetetrahydrofolate--tRNA-(uracil-5-)-methyltransferase
MNLFSKTVGIIGAGPAGSEAALFLGGQGVKIVLYEMRPGRMTPAHKTGTAAELVCSNSFKSDDPGSAHGLLKAELRLLKSPLLEHAYATRIPAGSALAVDREKFTGLVHAAVTIFALFSRRSLCRLRNMSCAL